MFVRLCPMSARPLYADPEPFSGTSQLMASTLTLPRWGAGWLSVPASASYTFRLGSDDGSLLYLNKQLLVDNSGSHNVVH